MHFYAFCDNKKSSNIGTLVQHTQLAVMGVTDLNNPPNAFILNTSHNPTGEPSGIGGNGATYTVLQCNPYNQNYTAQMAFTFVSDKIALRRKINSSWTNWKYLTFS